MRGRRLAPRVALAAALAATVACGGSSGSSIPEPPQPSNIGAGFTADQPSPGPDSVSLARGQASGDVITIRVELTDVQGVFGAAFDLVYDSGMATFLYWSPGEVLEQGGHVPEYDVSATTPGRIVVGAARKGVPAVDVSGTRTLLSLTFRVTRVGGAAVGFEAQELYDGAVPPQPVPGISWYGGTLTGV